MASEETVSGCHTTAIIFIKSSAGKLDDLNDRLRAVGPLLEKQFGVTDLSLLACTGHFDACVIGKFPSVNEISSFIVKELRNDKGDIVADTQTIVGWPL